MMCPTLPIVPLILAGGEMIRSTVAKSALEFYAGYTGGVCYAHWSTKAVQDELNRIAGEIQSQYEIAYVPQRAQRERFSPHPSARGPKRGQGADKGRIFLRRDQSLAAETRNSKLENPYRSHPRERSYISGERASRK